MTMPASHLTPPYPPILTMLPLTMITLTTLIISASLSTNILAEDASLFVLEEGDSSAQLSARLAVTLPSKVTCAAKCVSLEDDWSCGGFQYLPDGTCVLYEEQTFCASLNSAGTNGTTVETGAIYRRPGSMATSCPGIIISG